MLEELTALDELHNEIDTVGFLENIVHSEDEGVVDLVEDELFNLKRFD